MYKLYYSPGACSLAAHAILNEVGAEYKAEKVDLKNRSSDFLALNVRGAVPVLEEDGKVLREGAAILQHIIDTNDSTLLPRQGFERAKALEWLSFANSTVHPAYARVFGLPYTKIDDAAKETIKTNMSNQIQKYWDEVEAVLSKEGPYICGTQASAADFLLTVIANWTPMLFGDKVKFGSKTENLLRSISARPSYQKALKDEGVEYKAVA